MSRTVSVANGVNTLDAELSGKNVCAVRTMLSQALNIDPASIPRVNGETVKEDYVLCGGDELEFVKPSGEKGA